MDEHVVPQREELRRLKVVQLRHMLSDAHLPQSGLKEALITRLIGYHKELAAKLQTQKEEQPSESTGTEEDGVPADEGVEAMEVSPAKGEGRAGVERQEGEAAESVPAEEQVTEELQGENEPESTEEREVDGKGREESTIEEDPPVQERQVEDATMDATSAPPDPISAQAAQAEPQTGQRLPSPSSVLELQEQTTAAETVPPTVEVSKDSPSTHDDITEKPSPMRSSPSPGPLPDGVRNPDPRDPALEPPTADDTIVEETSSNQSLPSADEPSKPQTSDLETEEVVEPAQTRGTDKRATACDSGVEEFYGEQSSSGDGSTVALSSRLPPPSRPPPPSTSSDYFSDSTREEEQEALREAAVATSVPASQPTKVPPSSYPPPLMSQSSFPIPLPPQIPPRASHAPPSFAPLSLDSIPLPPHAAPLPRPSRPPATTPEQKPSGGNEPKGKRKKKKRRRRRHRQSEGTANSMDTEGGRDEPEVDIEYVQEDILQPGDPNYRQFHKIFEMFKISEPETKPEPQESPMQLVAKAVEASKKMAAAMAAEKKRESSDEEEEETEKEKEAPKISKKKLRKLNRLSVAQLKQLVERPDVVEMQDVTAQDPRLLIHLKSTRNTVPVPRHWCFKRKYLQGKRGIEKPPFNLPDFIKATGIMEMRQALEEKEDAKSLKQKTRERVRPKMGKLTIDYQKLHDAFFKWQTKPKMTIHGDLYYEGKEFETRLKEKKPGDLSDELRRALGMPTGQGKQKFPPPWLVAMQRYGPPPSYPNLKVPGLNAPIPEGCSFGYFVGGWGKPPVDETGRPLYGDVFGLDQSEMGAAISVEEVDESFWGELESEESEEEESSEEDDEEAEEAPKPEEIQAGLVTPMEGLVTPSGLTSIPAGLETPEMIQLRKRKIEEAMEQGGETPVLYTVLPEKPSAVGAAMMGSAHVYDIASAIPGAVKKTGAAVPEGVEVALDPSELDLDAATMTARYEEQLREQQGGLEKEDLSDMVAEHAARQKKRKRAAADSGGKASKKLKEFKF